MFQALLDLKEPPERIAFSFALGVFLGFSPLLGLHTVLGLGLAFWFRLNKAAVLLGVYANLPWIMAPYYALSVLLGVLILGGPGIEFPADVGFLGLFSVEFWAWVVAQWRLLAPAFLGSTILSSLLGLTAYGAMLVFLRRRKGTASPARHSGPAVRSLTGKES